MPISQVLFRRVNALMLAAGIAVLAAIVGASLWLTAATERNFSEVVAVREVRSAVADLMSLVQDAESGQRGYLLTRDARYLAPYVAATEEIEAALARLRQADDVVPGIESGVERLIAVMQRKLGELAETVELGEAGDFEGALAIVRQDAGRQAMDVVREDYAAILAGAEALLQSAIDRQQVAGARLRWVTIGGALVIFAMAAAATWTILAYTRELSVARTEVEVLNRGLEERVAERTDALVKANEEIQRFAYIVTHDLRAPLVNIMGFTSELESTFKPVKAYIDAGAAADDRQTAEAREALEVDVPEALGFIRSSTRKMDALINAILKISREGSRTLRPEPVDLGVLLEAAAGAVHHQATAEGGGITIDSKAGRIVSDRLSLDQILGNLLDNAIKYRSPDRPILITVRSRRERSGWVKIEVEDNGRGIAAGDHERIFELFRRSGTQNTQGEGIGLAHVRTMARNLGGDIAVKSELGRGTTFVLSLPPDLAAVKRSAAS